MSKEISKAKIKKIFETEEHILLTGTLQYKSQIKNYIRQKYLNYRCAILAYTVRATGATTGRTTWGLKEKRDFQLVIEYY